MARWLAFFLFLLALALGPVAHAAGRIATCVEVEVSSGDKLAFRRLVESELDRHPSHHAVTVDCISYLKVELIDLGRADGRYLTARINDQVPQRQRVERDGLAPALGRLLIIVLHNDPVTLRGPESQTWIGKQAAEFLRGRNRFGLEAFELLAPLKGGAQTLPGVALIARRETRAWHLGLRLASAYSTGVPEDQPELTLWVNAEAEGAFMFAPAANTSGFAALVLGTEYQRFRGPAPLFGPGGRGTSVEIGFSGGLRGGVEMFRASDSRLLVFAEALAPVFLSRDEDGGVVDQWLPTCTLGVGVVL